MFAGGAVKAVKSIPVIFKPRMPKCPADDAPNRRRRADHELQKHVLEIRRPPPDNLTRRHTHKTFIRIGEHIPQELNAGRLLPQHRDAEQPQPPTNVPGRFLRQHRQTLILHQVVHPRNRQPIPDFADLSRLAAGDITQQFPFLQPRSPVHLMHAQLKVVILEPVRSSQQRVQNRQFVNMSENAAEMRPKLPMRCPQKEGFHMLRFRWLLEAANHRALTAMFSRLENRQRFALRRVAQQERSPQKILRIFAAMHIQRPRDDRFNFRALIDHVPVKSGKIDGGFLGSLCGRLCTLLSGNLHCGRDNRMLRRLLVLTLKQMNARRNPAGQGDDRLGSGFAQRLIRVVQIFSQHICQFALPAHRDEPHGSLSQFRAIAPPAFTQRVMQRFNVRQDIGLQF